MPKAADIMTTEVITVSPDNTLEEVVKVLAEHSISGVPVVDWENKVVGVISETDLVKYSSKLHVIRMIDSSGWVSPHTDVTLISSFKKGFELLASTRVEQVMSKKVVSAKEDTSVEEIARVMKRRNINRVPVVGGQNELRGIVTRADMINYLAGR